MSEDDSETFRETPLSDDDRQSIVSVLKEEGFSEEQLNAMSSKKVWKLYIDSLSETMSTEISEIARAFERDPQLASMFNPLIKRMNRQLEDLVDSLEKELDKKTEKREDKP
jgi:succinyl-CoA synthetase beta subunit